MVSSDWAGWNLLRAADSNSHYAFPDWFFQKFLKLWSQVSMFTYNKKPKQFWFSTTPWYGNSQFWFSGWMGSMRGWILQKCIFSSCFFRNVQTFYHWGMGLWWHYYTITQWSHHWLCRAATGPFKPKMKAWFGWMAKFLFRNILNGFKGLNSSFLSKINVGTPKKMDNWREVGFWQSWILPFWASRYI